MFIYFRIWVDGLVIILNIGGRYSRKRNIVNYIVVFKIFVWMCYLLFLFVFLLWLVLSLIERECNFFGEGYCRKRK